MGKMVTEIKPLIFLDEAEECHSGFLVIDAVRCWMMKETINHLDEHCYRTHRLENLVSKMSSWLEELILEFIQLYYFLNY